jgi:hypothetical protein
MAKKPTAADAELILKLYDLRREAEMRKARNWWLIDFWPQNSDDIIKIAMALGTQENAWLRQVGGYWDMAANLVIQGALSEELFLTPGISGEMFFIFAKVQPYLKDFREKLSAPDAFATIEKLVMKTKAGRERLKTLQGRQAAFLKRRAEGAKAS